MTHPIVFGENLAAAVLVLNRLKNGLDVSVATSKPIVTKFAGERFGDQIVDRGMVLIEPQRPDDLNSDISKYRGEFRTNSLPFLGNVSDWFKKNDLSFDEASVSTLFRGLLVKDFFIADSLDVLNHFTIEERTLIRSELKLSIKKLNDEFHPRNKFKNAWYENSKYLAISRILYGETFTSTLVGPYLYKIYGALAENLVASEHRSAWVPMFFPESILASMDGDETNIDEKRFLYPSKSSFAEYVYQIETFINKNVSRASMKFEDLESFHRTPNDGKRLIAYFGSPKTLNQMETFNTRINDGRSVYIKANAPMPRTVFIVDQKWCAFRFNLRNCQSASDGYVCVEFGVSAAHKSDDFLIQESLVLSEFLGVDIEPQSAKVAESKYPLRTGQSKDLFDQMDAAVDFLRVRRIFGYPICEVNGSINDQICAANATHSELQKLD